MLRVVVIALLVVLAIVLRPKPVVCTGLGVETRPLTGVLADIGIPAGGLQCGAERDAEWVANHRSVELGDGADEAFAAWKAHLASRGWQETTTPMELADNGVAEAAARAGHPISACTATHRFKKEGIAGEVSIGVSYCVPDKPGWTQVAYAPVSPDQRQ
jgi:hypothetical protein